MYKYHLQNIHPGYQVFNYIDKPDLNMNEHTRVFLANNFIF